MLFNNSNKFWLIKNPLNSSIFNQKYDFGNFSPPPPGSSSRITDSGDFRITDSDDFRITD